MDREAYRLVAEVLNDRINELRDNNLLSVHDRSILMREVNSLMDSFVKVFQANNEFFSRQAFEREVQRFRTES
jgi:hypothetical protein